METYHSRHPDKAITSPAELAEVVSGQKFLTLALCAENRPYLVTITHAFDTERNCFYFHCSPVGRKVDLIRANPQVYGQVLEDRGYLAGQCDHSYRTVQFDGRAEMVSDPEEKLHALRLLIERLEPEPEPVKARLLKPARLDGVAIVRVTVTGWSGKKNG
ncbi:MAG: pyridoxamine 5'-phosphate oxidase family protein [candidate division WOR-3 bacterium]|nr:pyridoxamine 5'-phosphate oxidase family protein [candidate division WOR-3 bacterium]